MKTKVRLSQTEIVERAITRGLLLIALSSIGVLGLITVFIMREGLPIMLQLGLGDFLLGTRWAPSTESFGILPMILGSLWVTLGALVIGVPLGIACAVFLVELAPPLAAALLRPAIQLLAGIPSVIYGFWGLTTLVPLIRERLGGPGLSVLAGAIILGIMILPTVIAISEDALRALPRTYKEASLSLGASHWQTIWRAQLPAARSGIVAAVVLGMGRAVGETMAVIMVLGNAVQIPGSALDPARTLTTNIGIEMAYASGDHRAALFATGIVLFAIIMLLTGAANLITGRR
ncbi:MAG: phosphate ABC transporter permease subunit PstC [Chloroflexota bacterium]